MVPRPIAGSVVLPSPNTTCLMRHLKGVNLVNKEKLPDMSSVAPLSTTSRCDTVLPILTDFTVRAIIQQDEWLRGNVGLEYVEEKYVVVA